ncbi:MAG: endonuclease/exonuclease/phosphatase family protein [Propionibacteriales bacterium]|nr:endonuclease/exonuclease/phosphatase family protein [Propionibacteriales bacterium]
MLVMLPAVMAVVVRLAPALQENAAVAMAASFISYGIVGWVAAVVLAGIALLRGRRSRAALVITAISVAGLVIQGSWLMPTLVRDTRPIADDQLRVVSLNMLAGQADTDQVARHARYADVLVLVEITPSAEQALVAAGVARWLPYRIGRSVPGTQGTMVWSKWPLSDTSPIPGNFGQWLTRARTPIGPVTVAGVHPCNPLCGTDAWLQDGKALAQAVRPGLTGPMIVAGDFNSVDDHPPMRDLYATGLRGADDLAGTGWQPTYPSGQKVGGIGIPPMIEIDHILLSPRLTATSYDTFTVPGTDHLGVTARIGLVQS